MKPSLLSRSICVGILAAATSLSVSAETFKYPTIEDDRPGGFTLTPLVGQYNLDGDRTLDDETYFGFGVGYRFSDPYMVEFAYTTADAKTKAGADQGDIKQYRLEMLFDVAEYGNWTPYLSLGGARTEFGNNVTVIDDEGAMTAGFGTRYNFSERVALRGDARYIKAVGDSKAADVLLGLGLQVFLGETSSAPVEPEVVAVAQPVAEKPAAPSFAELCAQAGGSVEGSDCVKKSLSTERVNLNVQFEYNSDKVVTDYMSEVQKLADFMSAYPSSTAVIEGHTDSTGSDVYNQNLSQRRVNEVVRLLSTNFNIAADRLSAIGYGETQPIASNDTAEGRAQNRRVVASITAEIEETITLDVK